MTGADDERAIRRFVGVYNAEGTLRGEVAYWIGRRRGRAQCALCDITHGNIRERTDWKECRATLPVPFDTYHLDDQPPEIRRVTSGHTPSVVALTPEPVLLLEPADLEACQGSPARLVEALRSAAAREGLAWPA